MKLSLCNEVLQPMPFAQQCAWAAGAGYHALELAPFTLAEDPRTLTEAKARELRQQADDHGLAISSLHWLLVKPEGLSMVTPDAALRGQTLGFLRQLIDFAAACGASVLVHGSPKQRSPAPGQSLDDALARLESALAELAPQAQLRLPARGFCTWCSSTWPRKTGQKKTAGAAAFAGDFTSRA